MAKKESLKDRIHRLKEQKTNTEAELKKALNECEHEFAHGYTLEPVVYCTVCDREATDIFPGMAYKHIEKLVK